MTTPRDLYAERDLIGALIIDRWSTERTLAHVTVAHFTDHAAATLFLALGWAHRNQPIERRYEITDGQLRPVITGLGRALRAAGVTTPGPYVDAAEYCAVTTLGYRAELTERLQVALDARRRILELTDELDQLRADDRSEGPHR